MAEVPRYDSGPAQLFTLAFGSFFCTLFHHGLGGLLFFFLLFVLSF